MGVLHFDNSTTIGRNISLLTIAFLRPAADYIQIYRFKLYSLKLIWSDFKKKEGKMNQIDIDLIPSNRVPHLYEPLFKPPNYSIYWYKSVQDDSLGHIMIREELVSIKSNFCSFHKVPIFLIKFTNHQKTLF